MNDFLFDTPIWALGLPLIVAIGLLVSGNARQNSNLLRGGLAALLIVLLWGVVGYFVDTPKEAASRRTRQLIAAVDARDWETAKNLLDPKTSLLMYRNRDEIIDAGRRTVEQQNVKNFHITALQAESTASTVTVTVRLFTEQEATGGRPFPTDWKFDWHNLGSGWQLYTIEYLQLGDVPRSEIDRRLVPPK